MAGLSLQNCQLNSGCDFDPLHRTSRLLRLVVTSLLMDVAAIYSFVLFMKMTVFSTEIFRFIYKPSKVRGSDLNYKVPESNFLHKC